MREILEAVLDSGLRSTGFQVLRDESELLYMMDVPYHGPSARGAAWDRLFLTFMIRHHEGALQMVKTLFDSPGGGQGPEIFGYATGVDADQRGEIERMQKMVKAMKGKTTQ